MKRLCCLSLALLLLPGCWKGGALAENRIAYKHDAVVWVYQAGGQIGRWGIMLVPVRNDLLDLQPGDGCVHVREGQTGGQCSATPQADLQLSHALDFRTGRAIFARGPAKRVEHPEPACHADTGHWELPIEGGLSAYVAGEGGRLYLRLPSEILVLHLKDPDPEVTYEPCLGVPIAACRMPDDLVVLGLSQGYVVCVDLKTLRKELCAQACLPQNIPGR